MVDFLQNIILGGIMIHCDICKGTVKSGCICLTVARELFPDIDKGYTEDSAKIKQDPKNDVTYNSEKPY